MKNIEIYEPVIFLNQTRISIGEHTRIDSFVKIEGGEGVEIGNYVHIASFCHVGIGGGRVMIGDYACLSSGAKIVSGTNRVTGKSCSAMAPKEMQVIERSITKIGAYAWVCSGAIVLQGIVLGEGAVLAAGSIALCDIPSWEIWAGNPAKFKRAREIQ